MSAVEENIVCECVWVCLFVRGLPVCPVDDKLIDLWLWEAVTVVYCIYALLGLGVCSCMLMLGRQSELPRGFTQMSIIDEAGVS